MEQYNIECIAEEKLREFLQSELDEYNFTWKIEKTNISSNNIFFEVTYINPLGTKHVLNFYYNNEEGELYIDMYEDSWQLIRHWDWHVKYFWMKILWGGN